jgi:hypothetical protein
MAGQLITLPLRAGTRAARAVLGTGIEAAGQAAALAGQILKAVSPSHTTSAPDRDQASAAAAPAATRTPDVQPAPEPELPPRPAAGEVPVGSRPTSQPAPLQDLPAHVSEESELVESFAEPGAEDGAGAQVTMDSPWEGYDAMSADELIIRLGESDPAELAAVKLYESAKRRRATVLKAVDREFQSRQGSRRPT